MILEVAILKIKQGLSKDFESAFNKAEIIISSMSGYISHQLKKCIEESDKYILLVNCKTLEDHKIGFRQSKNTRIGNNYGIIITNHFQP